MAKKRLPFIINNHKFAISNIRIKPSLIINFNFYIMKKSFLLFLLSMLLCTQSYTQINKLGFPNVIGWPDGWYTEGEDGTFTLENDGNAIKINATSEGTSLKGKFQQRFTPSVGGEYILRFKAKAEIPNQTIKIDILRTDAWLELTNKPSVTIATSEFEEYEIIFTYNEEVRDKTPAGFQLEFFVVDVQGSLWFDDVRLYEKNNILIAYQDDFENDLYYGQYEASINSWGEITTWNGQDLPVISKEKVNNNTVLQITQPTQKNQSWDASVKRYWWGIKDVKYRIQFDISCTENIDRFGVEIWSKNNKIRPTSEFPVTTEIQKVNFITADAPISDAYRVQLYAGRIPVNAKTYIDNILISPIHLYNVNAKALSADKIEITWLHSGYLNGDKLQIELVDGETNSMIKDDVEIIDGGITINLNDPLTLNKNYSIKLTDKVAQESYTVYNTIQSETFVYSLPEELSISADEIATYPAESLNIIKKLTLTGNWKAENLNTLQTALGNNEPQITIEQVYLSDEEPLNCSVTFTAMNISYSRTVNETQETICIPFALTTIPEDITLMEYIGNTNNTVNFKKVDITEPNTPYLITGNNKEIEFSATDITITADPISVNPDNAQYIYTGTYSGIATEEATNFFIENGETFDIAENTTTIPPFRAYFTGESSTDKLDVYINNGPTNIDCTENTSDNDVLKIYPMDGGIKVISNETQLLNIYSIDGCLIQRLNLVEGENSIILNKGFYLINKHKIFVK